MKPIEAAWVREQVWPRSWLRHYRELPGPFTNCACQRPPSCECQRGDHHACRHDGHPINETVIATSRRRAARFSEPHEHRAPAGRHGRRITYSPNVLAWVWLAGSPCRELCACVCHRPTVPAPPAPIRTEQLDLFAGAP